MRSRSPDVTPTPPHRKRGVERRQRIVEEKRFENGYRRSPPVQLDEPLEEPPPDYSPPSPPPMPKEERKVIQKTRFAADPPKAKSGNIIVDWKNFLHNKNAEDGFSSFHELFVSLLDKWVPVKEIVIDQKEKKTSKWNTKELKDMKNKLEALQVVKTVRRDAESKKAYDIFKKIYNLKINEKIKENNENRIRKASNKSRAMWKIIKPAKGKSEEEKSNLTAGEMNEYLAGVGQSTAEEVDQTSVSYADYLEDLKNRQFEKNTLLFIVLKTDSPQINASGHLLHGQGMTWPRQCLMLYISVRISSWLEFLKGQSIRKLVGKIRSASAERKARQRAKRSPSPSYQQGHIIDGNIHGSMENGRPVQRYYLGEDPFAGSIYGRENKYDGVKPVRISRRNREDEPRSILKHTH
ncbi:hypothetical protein HHI36_015573 [Cryptolaemus montrouzieri]|uniref:Uncharacterized protein n=1 Tax=Cryptolaemus montrouzieri TaxID=559131 RepID=A0ABD2N7A2_9CUCU